MTPTYSPALVTVSIVIAVMASYVAIDMAGRVHAAGRRVRGWWWAGGSIAMGVGIWSMHFVGMLAFHLPVIVRYDLSLVLLSVVVAIAASALALFVASRPALPLLVLVASSLLMGAAINGMHYIGMAAMRLPAVIVWNWRLVAASIAIALSASFLGLLLAFRLRQIAGLFRWRRLFAAALLGFAVAGMHYTGMAAARFVPAPGPADLGAFSLHTTGVGAGVALGTFVILSMALGGAAFDERSRLLRREQEARHEAEAANRIKDEFLATLSHELRTPLNVIVGRAQMLRAVAADPDHVRQTAETIARNGDALRRIVEDLLDISRMRIGGVQLEWESVDVAALFESAASALQPTAEAKGVRLHVSVAAHMPRITGDHTRLQQVIWNLLTNAVKFTGTGGHVYVEARHDDSHVILTVSDTGQGIDPDFLPHVFDLFRQAEPAATRSHGGLGIGLSIVKRLVELHGGSVSASSAGAGRGAAFTVRLPFHTAASAQSASWAHERQPV